MKSFLKSIWDFANNKKSPLAAVAGTALAWAQAKGFLGAEDALYLTAMLTILTGVAVTHKVVKAVKNDPENP